MSTTEQHLMALQQQLTLHRTALQELWVEKAKHEQAIAAIKARLQASGRPCDLSPYDGPGLLRPQPLIPDEARQFVDWALGGPKAITKR